MGQADMMRAFYQVLLFPKNLRSHFSAFGHAFELGIRNRRMHGAKACKGAKAAIGAGHHALAAYDIGVLQQALFDELRMLNEIAHGIEHTGAEDFVVWLCTRGRARDLSQYHGDAGLRNCPSRCACESSRQECCAAHG
jgi:hypothetical protein